MGLQVRTRGKKDGTDHRNLHPGLVREVRGLPQGAGGGIHPEESRSGLHAGDDHLRGGRQLTMVTKTTVKSIELKFRIGEEFEEDTTDGRHCKTIVTLDGNVMTTKQNGTKPGDKNVVVVREFNDEGLTYKATCDGVTSTQKFKRE